MTGTQTLETGIPAGAYGVDPVHSSIGFAVTHNGVATFRSTFKDYDARLSGGESPQLKGTVEVGSVDIAEEMLKGHLLSPEFFDAERHPTLSFDSSELAIGENGSVRVEGTLVIGGQSRQVEASGRYAPIGADLAGQARVALSLAATVDRRDFGLDWQAQLPSGGDVLEWAVEIAVELELVEEGE